METKVVFRSLRMENFGCFQDHTVVFEPGLNQLIGPNESGKSTVIRALQTILFEDGPTSKKTVADQKCWTGEGPFRLTLIFAVGLREYMLIRDYGLGQDIMSDSDGLIYEGRAIREKLNRYFGTSNRRLFEAVFSFSSDYPDALEDQRTRLKAALETPLFSGFDRTRADAYLEEQIKSLDNPRAHGPRELDVLGEQIKESLRRKEESESRLESLGKAREELRQAQESVRQNEEEIDRIEKLVAGAEAYQHLDQKMGNLEERLQTHLTNYSRAIQTTETLEKLDKELNHLS
ncbi:MAG: AAA family ATPase, partial [candidate division Zixibacteria bacterium]|nr:AAA family ATPase [candidate division Zixibacteria bacterium]